MESTKDNALVRPGFRARVESVVRARSGEPVIAVCLGEASLRFAVPGRRPDGTVEGTREGRQLLAKLARGAGTAIGYVLHLASAAGSGGGGAEPRPDVTGPADAAALSLTDRLRKTRGAWLALTPSSVALVETGPTYLDPADAPEPEVVWESGVTRVHLRRRTLTWPDGSVFRFPLRTGTEDAYLRQFTGPAGEVNWPR